MIKSMTGYGRAREVRNLRDITVEIRAVNNRYLDCTVKMPRTYLFAEDALKKRVQAAVPRGKVDVFITVDASAADSVHVELNRPLAAGYLKALQELNDLAWQTADGMDTPEYNSAPDRQIAPDSQPVSDRQAAPGRQSAPGLHPATSGTLALAAARFPDVLTVTRAAEDLDAVTADLCVVLDDALEAFHTMRTREGAKLAEDIAGRLDTIEQLTGEVERRSPETVAAYREKFLRRIREALEGAAVDEQRVLTEAAVYADKVAVDEETVRLRSHLAQLRTMLASDDPQGRKMDFLIQEVNREANTIGSKCADVSITRMVVDMKAEVEKIREQVQNVE